MEFTKVLMVVAVVAVALAVLNLGAVMFQIGQIKSAGYASTESGSANLTIQASVSINFTTKSINFGSGAVDTGSGCSFATLNSNSSVNCGTGAWTSYTLGGLVLENIGGTNANLTLKSEKNSTNFIGGDNPRFDWEISESESGSCSPNIGSGGVDVPTGYQPVPVIDGVPINVCSNFTAFGPDELSINVWLEIPQSAVAGPKGTIITADAYIGAI